MYNCCTANNLTFDIKLMSSVIDLLTATVRSGTTKKQQAWYPSYKWNVIFPRRNTSFNLL